MKRDGAVQQRGLMSRFYSFWGTFPNGKTGAHTGYAAVFSAPAEWGTRTAQAVRPNGRVFFAEVQRGGFAAPRGGNVAATRGRGKKEGTPAVSLPL